MANIITYDEVTGNILKLDKSVDQHDPQYINRTDILINPDISILSTIDKKYVKVSEGILIEMTAQEKADKDQLILDSTNSFKTNNINNFDITIKDAFISWLKIYNSKVPAQYQVTPQELKTKLLSDLGL